MSKRLPPPWFKRKPRKRKPARTGRKLSRAECQAIEHQMRRDGRL